MTEIRERLLRALLCESASSSDFDLNPDIALPENRTLRPAGVLVAVEMKGDVPHVILTKRASHLKHHPGQIAFPGGKQDEGDHDVTAAALREAWEEVGLPTENVEVLGLLPSHETVTSFMVTPVIGLVRSPFEPRAEVGEVEEIFRVPLDQVVNSRFYSTQSRRWRGRQRLYFTVPYGPYYIWGATARILRGLAERMEQ
ncbi:CoA pyrophosphatase [Shimia sp. FJ5]|uniref:CoA pyrophosphatase n=1 Tax=Shimia sp. FJ5 TaxID=3079054 RepID=UPI002616C5A0|nr:CoA pyrophosphatase [Shimia sp. FJ5]MDV4144636.1 CoA pyrophosphatase [Shimia sp. FJ5]